jgi:hypothetical protein
MKTIKIVAGLTWAFLCLVIIIVLFPAMNPLASATSKLPFMKISPRYSGGVVVTEVQKGDYTIGIRKAVFDGLFGEKKEGFVQVDWKGKLPNPIADTIDFNNDNVKDFVIRIDTLNSQTQITPLNPKVKGVWISTKTSYGWAVRVGLVK